MRRIPGELIVRLRGLTALVIVVGLVGPCTPLKAEAQAYYQYGNFAQPMNIRGLCLHM